MAEVSDSAVCGSVLGQGIRGSLNTCGNWLKAGIHGDLD